MTLPSGGKGLYVMRLPERTSHGALMLPCQLSFPFLWDMMLPDQLSSQPLTACRNVRSVSATS